MPITKATGYKASDGVVYATIEEAQVAELVAIFNDDGQDPAQGDAMWDQSEIAHHIVKHSDLVLAALTTGPRSRPSTRKRAGTTNPKRATRTQAATGFKAMRDAVDHGGTNATKDADVPAEPVGAD